MSNNPNEDNSLDIAFENLTPDDIINYYSSNNDFCSFLSEFIDVKDNDYIENEFKNLLYNSIGLIDFKKDMSVAKFFNIFEDKEIKNADYDKLKQVLVDKMADSIRDEWQEDYIDDARERYLEYKDDL